MYLLLGMAVGHLVTFYQIESKFKYWNLLTILAMILVTNLQPKDMIWTWLFQNKLFGLSILAKFGFNLILNIDN